MTSPSPAVADLVARLDTNLIEDFEERAAIVEFDGNQPRELAECLALLDILRRHPGALLGVSVLALDLNRESRYVVTTDTEIARQHLAALGINVTGTVDLVTVLNEYFGGIALLSSNWRR